MRTAFTDQNIKIRVDNTYFSVMNIVFDQFARPLPRHSHGSHSFEIHYIPYGRGQVRLDGVLYNTSPSTLYVTGPHVEYEQIPFPNEPMSEYTVYFTLENAGRRRPKTPETVSERFASVPLWVGEDGQNIYPVIQQLFYELEHRETGYMELVDSLLREFIVKMVRNYEGTESRAETHFDTATLTDRKYLIAEESFLYDYETLTLDSLSEKLGLSTRQTERVLNVCYGKNFHQKKAEAKMTMAAIFLKDPGLSVTEVSEKLNYSSTQHFSHAFSQYYGITPSKWRKKNRSS